MKIAKKLILVLTFLNISTFCYENIEEYIIEKTNHQFNLVNDYQVDMIVRVSVPAFRMPKKKYKVFYSKPNKVKVKA